MKTKYFFPLLLLLSIFALAPKSAKAQQIDVTVNPLGLLFGDLNVGADFMLSENLSVEGTLGLNFGKSDFNSIEAKYSGIPVTVFGKYYFSPREGADRFYADAWLRFVNRSYKWEGANSAGLSDYSQTRVGIGFGIGFKTVSSKGIVFDIGLGAGRALLDKTSFKDSSGTQTEIDWPEVMFVGKLGVGYRFGQ